MAYEARFQFVFAGLAALLLVKVVLTKIIATRWTSFELTDASVKQGDTRASFPGRVALNLIGILTHLALGPLSLYMALRSTVLLRPEEALHMQPELSAAQCEVFLGAGVCGVLFTTYALFQTLGLFVGWEAGLDMWAHHLTFLALSLVCCYYYAVPEMSLYAMQQELSTPALLVMLTLRRVRGYGSAVALAQRAFAATFFLCRPVMFSLGMYRGLQLWLTQPDVYTDQSRPGQIPLAAYVIVHVLYSAGLGLQFYWLVGIVQKARRGAAAGKAATKAKAA